MKKLLLFSLVFMFAVAQMYAQPRSQRKILIEEFTNASCAPCAAANPTFNAFINTNIEKIVPMKYQVWWPGFDPMYNQNTIDVGVRVPYYNVSGVPHALLDGNVVDDHPANFTQAQVDAEYAVSSPFTVDVTHTINATFDSIFITVTITATEAFTAAGELKGHCAITEDLIHFATAPGSNGETDFEWVMKKMYPDANGAALPATWTNGQVETLTYNVPIPSWTYNINQLSVVAWVQDNSDKNVKQAGKSPVIVQPGDAALDAGISSVTGVTVVSCAATTNAVAVLKNFGTTVITSATIYYQVDNDVPVATPWTGNLAAAATANVNLTNIPVTGGNHILKIWVAQPNGVNDFYPINNSFEKKLTNYQAAAAATPLAQDFEDPTFPPAGYFVNDVNNDNAGWAYTPIATGGYGLSSGCTWVNFYNITAGKTDELYLPAVDLTNNSATSLTFDVAYAQYQAENDRLKVDVTTDCGASWVNCYNKAGTALMTAPATTSQFAPTASQWRTELIALPAATAGQSKAIIRFVTTSAYGNNLWVDNINVTASGVGIDPITNKTNNIEIYPNPFTSQAVVDLDLVATTHVNMNVYNAMGILVYSQDLGNLSLGNHKVNFDGSELANGLYYFNFSVNGQSIVKKISVQK